MHHPFLSELRVLTLLTLSTRVTFAQDTPQASEPTDSTSSPSFTAAGSSAASASDSSAPSIIDHAGYAATTSSPPSNHSSGDGDDGHNDGLLNYYFLLLALFIVAVLLVFWSFSRKRRAKQARQHVSQQDALATDLRAWRRISGRSRGRYWGNEAGNRNSRLDDEEGLNERGEAPPPYIKEPDRARVREERGGIELQSWETNRPRNEQTATGKPPDYTEPDRREGNDDATRPP
ncbi:MAG: hypothetical protein OHK93_000651 [Ramalina farinacea]|uniref:Uncharacterized protein n=1 Tax=Ramalina farinacea TaxID=258253 RepID=A0AA43QIV5_9LECA|nr:hypothetical protein [Ramalina farinacea]